MAEPLIIIEKTFDGRHAVFLDGEFAFAADTEARCHAWVQVNVTHPRFERGENAAALSRAIDILDG